ncbi:DUF6894 family protein [Aureimonas altamirensis]|uniref:DUF6894 family protein n=1 Tax=Aureimonas altamirensis TaxID=370622 RepID=UPI003AFAE217
MPRYFFQVTGSVSHVDHEGRELPNEAAAWALAIISTGELLRDLDGEMPDHARICTTVTDELGRDLISLTFTAEWYSTSVESRLIE